MEAEELDVEFHPSQAMAPTEAHEWCTIIAKTLESTPGAVAIVFDRVGDGWAIRSFYWFKPGAPSFQVAETTATVSLRARAAEALRAAGKNLITTH